jgi:acid phosphatase type 7
MRTEGGVQTSEGVGQRFRGWMGVLSTCLTVGCIAGGTAENTEPSEDPPASEEDPSVTLDTEVALLPICDLLVNPGAETGDVQGWTIESGEWGVTGGDQPVPFGGDFFFSTGEAATSVAFQDVNLLSRDVAVDTGAVTAHLEVQFRDGVGEDAGYLGLMALDGADEVLAEVYEGPLLDQAWHHHRAHLTLPTETVTVRVRLGSVRHLGPVNDGVFDDVSLCVDEVPPPVASDIRYGPWLNWVTTDAISVLWETEGTVVGGVEWSQGLDFEGTLTESDASDHHELRITGLEPDTVYAYRVRSEDAPGEVYSFRTAPRDGVPFEFAVWGDNQNGPDIFAEVVDRMEAAQPDFLLSVGDIVQSGTEANYRDELLDPILDLALDTPFLVAAGNHERIFDAGAAMFERHLAQPGDEHCFTWTYGGAFFLFLDTELSTLSGPQLLCIEEAFASDAFASSEVQMALFHYPPRIEYWAFYFYGDDLIYDGDDDIRDVLEPVFHDAGVDLVFNGHNHLYAYTPAGTYSDVTWVTTGGGGGDIDSDFWVTGDWDGITSTVHAHHFVQVAVDGKEVSVSAIGMDGATLHQFALTAD